MSWPDGVSIGAAVSLLVGLAGVLATFFSSNRNLAAQREERVASQVDSDRQAMREERDALKSALESTEAEIDRLRERVVIFRIALREAGLNPDDLLKGESNDH